MDENNTRELAIEREVAKRVTPISQMLTLSRRRIELVE